MSSISVQPRIITYLIQVDAVMISYHDIPLPN